MFDPIEYLTTARWQTVNLGLSRTRELLARLGNPQDTLRFVHVAGTNGKGSTCAFVASVLEQAGYQVGLFTSPALYCFEDRIRVNGVNITSEELFSVTERVKEAADKMEEHPTEFELLTAVAFCHFAQKNCDIVIAEVGMGGRLDSTNVIARPEVAVITPIAFDHCAFLGNTLPEIAREKAGIIKAQSPCVSAPQAPPVAEVIAEVSQRELAPLRVVDLDELEGSEACFSYRGRHDLSLGLAGAFQLINAASALDAIDVLKQEGWAIPEEAVRSGLARTAWPGRFEVVSEEPLIIFDGGHNVAGMEALVDALEKAYPSHYRIALSGVLEDKAYEEMARLLALSADEVITVTPSNPRALPAKDYAHVLERVQKTSEHECAVVAANDIVSGVEEALLHYQEHSKKCPTLIFVCGSLYLLGAVMEVLRQVGVAL